MKKPTIHCKRVYDTVDRSEGYLVLVDRIWPRGIKKAELQLDQWCKELAPSKTLRQWFGHDPKRWANFCKKYYTELETKGDAIQQLIADSGDRPLILLYAARDTEHNNAVALASFLAKH